MLEAPPVDHFHSFANVSFAGVACAQFYADFYLWEGVLNDRTGRTANPTGLPAVDAIVELGTFKGGFSLYLASQAHWRGLGFRTYDVVAPGRQIPGFVQLDIFAKADEIGEWIRAWETVIVFCDGGNKARELKTFSRYLDSNDLIATHDWGEEITETDVPAGLEMVYGDWCDQLGSATRFFRKTPVAASEMADAACITSRDYH